MFNTLKSKFREADSDMLVMGGIFAAALAAVTVLGVAQAKADREETRQAIAEGKTVITLFGQKAIF